MTWLGQRRTQHEPEVFPDGAINGRQLATLLNMDDRNFGRLIGTGSLR